MYWSYGDTIESHTYFRRHQWTLRKSILRQNKHSVCILMHCRLCFCQTSTNWTLSGCWCCSRVVVIMNALVCIDMQNDFCLPDATLCVKGAMACLPNVIRAVETARTHGLKIFWVIREHDARGVCKALGDMTLWVWFHTVGGMLSSRDREIHVPVQHFVKHDGTLSVARLCFVM